MRASDYQGHLGPVHPLVEREPRDDHSPDITEEVEIRILSKIEEAVGPLTPRTSSASRRRRA